MQYACRFSNEATKMFSIGMSGYGSNRVSSRPIVRGVTFVLSSSVNSLSAACCYANSSVEGTGWCCRRQGASITEITKVNRNSKVACPES